MDDIERGDLFVHTARVTVRPENRMELLQTIWSLLEPIRREKGCLTYRFYEEAGEENSFMLISEWETQEYCQSHLHSDNFAVLHGSIMILGNRSDVDFKLLSSVAGLDTMTQSFL
jgi:quinol monooxygenase YgiN